MSRILAVACKELVETFRDRRAMLMTIATAALAGPIFLALIFNMIASQSERARDLRLPVGGAEHAPAGLRREVVSRAGPGMIGMGVGNYRPIHRTPGVDMEAAGRAI